MDVEPRLSCTEEQLSALCIIAYPEYHWCAPASENHFRIDEAIRPLVAGSTTSSETPVLLYESNPSSGYVSPMDNDRAHASGSFSDSSWPTNLSPPISPPLSPAGLGSAHLQWAGVQAFLQEGEKAYLSRLGLGVPLLIHDHFFLKEDGAVDGGAKTVCVLFQNILLFCRYKLESSLTSFDKTPPKHRLVVSGEEEKLFIYGHLYPRHIHRVHATAIGMSLPKDLILNITGFRVECKGLWFGDDRANEWLMLNFQPSCPGDDIPRVWIQALYRFGANENPHEIGTIFDRLPLDAVCHTSG